MVEIVYEISSITGECTTTGYTGMISCTTMSFNNAVELEVSTTNATRTMHTIKVENIELTRPFDKASVPIIDAMIAGRSLGSTTIHILKPAGDTGDTAKSQVEFMTYTLFDTMIASHNFSADDSGAPTETLSLNFTKVLWNYSLQSQGATLGGNLFTGYDLLLGQKATS